MIYLFNLLCHYGKQIYFKNKSTVWRWESSCLRRQIHGRYMLSECEHSIEITQILQRKQRQRDFQAEIFN